MKNLTPTPHNDALMGDIAETVLLPGDPLRAKFIAENFLEDAVCFNTVRNMLGYTGTYKGKRVSVMGSGMGNPSMGIYSYELIHFYGVKNLIRIGTAGTLDQSVKVRDIVVGMACSTNSNYLSQFDLPGSFAPICSYELLEKAIKSGKENNVNLKVGNILSTDVFYAAFANSTANWKKMGILAAEMESLALYSNAIFAGVNAICILSISDSHFEDLYLTAEERQETFTEMMQLALGMI